MKLIVVKPMHRDDSNYQAERFISKYTIVLYQHNAVTEK